MSSFDFALEINAGEMPFVSATSNVKDEPGFPISSLNNGASVSRLNNMEALMACFSSAARDLMFA